MLTRTLLCLTGLFIFSQPTNVNAESGDREEILAVMEKAFAAVRSSIADDWRAIQLAEGTTLSFRPDPDGQPDELELRIANNEDFIADLKPDSNEYIERWTGEPIIMIRGPIAVIWGEYEFWINGEFSHCGVDSADLVKISGEWKVANFMWTVEKEDCPTAPSR